MIVVGNDGEGDFIFGLDCVQVFFDCVNVLVIGVCDILGKNWQCVFYSFKGFGCSLGFVKLDLVGFGGEFSCFFVVVVFDVIFLFIIMGGIFFVMLSVLWLGVGICVYFGGNLNYFVICIFFVYISEEGDQGYKEIGWG